MGQAGCEVSTLEVGLAYRGVFPTQRNAYAC